MEISSLYITLARCWKIMQISMSFKRLKDYLTPTYFLSINYSFNIKQKFLI